MINSEAMIQSRWDGNKVVLDNMNPYPLVICWIPDVKVSWTIQNKSSFIISMQVLLVEFFSLWKLQWHEILINFKCQSIFKYHHVKVWQTFSAAGNLIIELISPFSCNVVDLFWWLNLFNWYYWYQLLNSLSSWLLGTRLNSRTL